MDYFDKVKEIVVEQLNVSPDAITMKTNFEELNADSLDVVEVIMTLEEAFDIEIPDEDAEKLKDIGAVVDYISDHAV